MTGKSPCRTSRSGIPSQRVAMRSCTEPVMIPRSPPAYQSKRRTRYELVDSSPDKFPASEDLQLGRSKSASSSRFHSVPLNRFQELVDEIAGSPPLSSSPPRKYAAELESPAGSLDVTSEVVAKDSHYSSALADSGYGSQSFDLPLAFHCTAVLGEGEHS